MSRAGSPDGGGAVAATGIAAAAGGPMSATIELRASGALRAHLPEGADGGRARLDIAPDTTLAALLEGLGIAPDRALLVIVSGRSVSMAARASTALVEGDTVTLAPPIRAG